jgi:anti-sigma regulatory factor (Ser/Thr protein kinase)
VTDIVAARPKTRIFPGTPDQVAHARRFVGRVLDGNPVADDAALLTSELATNAVVHTASGQGGTFAVAVRQHAAGVRVEVWDAGAVTAPVVRSPDQEREGGAGLGLVETIATRWGHLGDQGGRVVWFEVEWPLAKETTMTKLQCSCGFIGNLPEFDDHVLAMFTTLDWVGVDGARHVAELQHA